jgi:hypothetical protein
VLARLIDKHLVLGDLRDGVDGNQGLCFTEAEKPAVFDEQKTDLLLSVVDEEVGHLADAVTVFVFHLTAADIVGRSIDRLTTISKRVESGLVVGCH